MTTGWPTFTLESSSNKWGDATYTWATLSTGKVRDLSIRRGRSSERQSTNAGSLAVTLSSKDRAYDPEQNSLLNGTPVRLKVVVGANTYYPFTGYVDAWNPVDEISNTDSVTRLSAKDGFKILARNNLRGYQAAVLRDAPFAYYRLGESSGTTMVDATGNGHNGTYVAAPSTASSLVSGGDGARTFNGTTQYGYASGFTLPFASDSAQPFTLECWVKGTGASTSWYAVGYQGNAPYTAYPNFALISYNGSGNQIKFQVQTQTTFITITYSWTDDLAAHHVVGTWDGATPLLYVDGVSVGSSSSTSPFTGASSSSTLNVGGSESSVFAETLDEVAVYTSVLTATQIVNHYKAGSFFAVETSSTRVTRVLDMLGWPSALRNLDTGTVSVGVNDSEISALSALRQAETGEAGTVFMSGDGKVTFQNRNHTDTLSPATTISDTAPSTSFQDFGRTFDESFLLNEIAVTWSTDVAPAIARDSTSIAQHGLVTEAVTALLLTQGDAGDLAGHLLAQYSMPVARVETCTVTVATFAGMTVREDIIGLELGQLVTVVRTPMGTGTQINAPYRVEGISHTITKDTWAITLQLSPAALVDWFYVEASASQAGLGDAVLD